MKVGIRKPSVKKSISARTTGKVKRKLKRMTNPLYGKKEWGLLRTPEKQSKAKYTERQPYPQKMQPKVWADAYGPAAQFLFILRGIHFC